MSYFAKLFFSVLLSTAWVCLGQDSLFEFRQLPPINEELYGCGPMLHPKQTYYISTQGDDSNDGLSLEKAWRSISASTPKLRAGDTLLIAEGEYDENGQEIHLNFKDYSNNYAENCGVPGQPIRVQAMPGQRVLIRGGIFLPAEKLAEGMRHTYQIPYDRDQFPCVWESGTQNKLENAGSLEKTEELPGTYFYDTAKKMLYVRFTAAAQPAQLGVRIQRSRVALRVNGSYIHIKGLWFANYGDAVIIRPNYAPSESGARDYSSNRVQHVTIEECGFYANSTQGVQAIAMQWCLFKNNHGSNNALRGGLMMQREEAQDNLAIGNVFGSCRDTRRLEGNHLHYLISQYGGVGQRNHIINNILDDLRSFRWKPVCPGSRFEGNYLAGNFAVDSGMTTKIVTSPEERLVLRHNIIGGNIHWPGNSFDNSKTSMDLYDSDKVFLNNYLARHKQANIDQALFADPAYFDFRLQEGSPLRGSGVGGSDLGLLNPAGGAFLYAGHAGNDQNSGKSVNAALLSLQAAADLLAPGDTLYILPGKYDSTLHIKRGGREGKPLRVRAHGKKPVWLKAVIVEAPWVELSGLSVSGAALGFELKAPDITLRQCAAYQCQAAGLRAIGAERLAVYNCTLADNQTGLELGTSGSVQIRDSILAGNQTMLSGEAVAQDSLLSSHNVLAGGSLPGYANWQVEDLRFVNPGKNDYRLQWDSPAAACDSFCAPAGATGVTAKPFLINRVRVEHITAHSAVALWETPDDDSFGSLEYWVQGESKRLRSASSIQGTRHAAGLKNLRPDCIYEYRVRGNGRRGNSGSSETFTFRTNTVEPEPRVYHLSPGGDDQADGLTAQTAWRTLQKASFAAYAGDTFLLQPGVYYDELAPMHGGKAGLPIVFRRNGDGPVIIDGQGLRFRLINLNAIDHIIIDGLTLVNPESGCRNAVIALHRCSDISISNCRIGLDKAIKYTSGPLLGARNCQRLRFENNEGWGGDYPLTLVDCNDVLIKNNTIVDGTMMGSHIVGGGKLTMINNLWFRPCIPGKQNQCLLFTNIKTDEIVCDYNLFYSPYPLHKVGLIRAANASPLVQGDNLLDWQKNSPFDQHSIQVDPLFQDYEKGDFRLLPGSPAIGAGKNGENIGAKLLE